MSEPEIKPNGKLPELSKAKKTAIYVTVFAAIFLFGVAMLLCGLGVFGGIDAFKECELSKIWLPSAFFTLAFCFFAAGLIGKNPVSAWLSSAFLVPGVIGLLAEYTVLEYTQLYPFYIAIPAFASLFRWNWLLRAHMYDITWQTVKPHLRIIIFFGGIAGIFCLQSFAGISWAIVLPILAGFLVLCAAYVIYKIHKYRSE